MKRILIAILVVITTHSTRAQYFPVDTARLNNAYKDLMNDPQNARAQKNYFDAFPNTWDEFIMTYQYFSDKEYDPTMYLNAVDHTNALYELKTIPDSLYCSKIISLSIGGRINKNVTNDFLGGLKILAKWTMKTKMNTMFALLSKLRKGHQFEFWSFYWANVHYRKEINMEFDAIKQKNEKTYPKEVGVMVDAYKYFHNGVNYTGNGFNSFKGDTFLQE